jgi:hypothetical protein
MASCSSVAGRDLTNGQELFADGADAVHENRSRFNDAVLAAGRRILSGTTEVAGEHKRQEQLDSQGAGIWGPAGVIRLNQRGPDVHGTGRRTPPSDIPLHQATSQE